MEEAEEWKVQNCGIQGKVLLRFSTGFSGSTP